MNENLDLTKILDGCPRGTKFYNTVYGEVSFIGISNSSTYPIELLSYTKQDKLSANIYITKDGRIGYNYDGECTLFPSNDQRDWSKFVRFWDKPKVDKFDINTLQPFDKVLVRDFLNEGWMADFFERIDENDVHYNANCVTSHWIQCIPYNEETKHLLGKTTDCSEYYKWWEE